VFRSTAPGPKISPQDRSELVHELDKIDSVLKKAGGIGRVRTKIDGPLPSAVRQRDKVKRRIQRSFGSLDSIEDHETALKKAFPNAVVDVMSLYGGSSEMTRAVGDQAGRVRKTEQEVLALLNEPQAVESMKGFIQGLLYKSLDDPDTAKSVGGIWMTGSNARFSAGVGPALVAPINSPINIYMNPNGIARLNNAFEDEAQALAASQVLLQEVRSHKQTRGTAQSGSSMAVSTFADSDPEVTAMNLAFHEWGHLTGFARSSESIDPNMQEAFQEWVKTGKGLPVNSTSKILENFSAELNAESSIFFEGMKDPQMAQEAKKFFAELGFSGVDVTNEAQVFSVYRALAVRSYYATLVAAMTEAQSAMLDDTTWNTIGKLGGYASSSREEALAEMVGLVDSVPDLASSLFKGVLSDPILSERMR
jgi:hypothetical protein